MSRAGNLSTAPLHCVSSKHEHRAKLRHTASAGSADHALLQRHSLPSPASIVVGEGRHAASSGSAEHGLVQRALTSIVVGDGRHTAFPGSAECKLLQRALASMVARDSRNSNRENSEKEAGVVTRMQESLGSMKMLLNSNYTLITTLFWPRLAQQWKL